MRGQAALFPSCTHSAPGSERALRRHAAGLGRARAALWMLSAMAFVPKKLCITDAAAPQATECVEGYSGCAGVERSGVKAVGGFTASPCGMACTGRQCRYLYLAAQPTMLPSRMETWSSAKSCATLASAYGDAGAAPRIAAGLLSTAAATVLKKPGSVGVLEPCRQKYTKLVWSAVRLLTTLFPKLCVNCHAAL